MIARAIAAKVPFSFVAADSVYGTGEIETLLRKAGKGYVLGVASNHVFRSWSKPQPVAGTASAIAQSFPKQSSSPQRPNKSASVSAKALEMLKKVDAEMVLDWRVLGVMH